MSHPSVSPEIILIVIAVAVVFLLLARFGFLGGSRNSGNPDPGGSSRGVQGTGRFWKCQRCGVEFQPERVETMPNGQERHWNDDRCPHCGWDKDFKDRNNDGRPDYYE